MRPIAKGRCPPVPGESAARHRVDDQSGIGAIRAAVYTRACSTVDWILGGDLSDRRGTAVSARNIPRVLLSIDAESVHEAVTAYEWEGEGCSKER